MINLFAGKGRRIGFQQPNSTRRSDAITRWCNDATEQTSAQTNRSPTYSIALNGWINPRLDRTNKLSLGWNARFSSTKSSNDSRRFPPPLPPPRRIHSISIYFIGFWFPLHNVPVPWIFNSFHRPHQSDLIQFGNRCVSTAKARPALQDASPQSTVRSALSRCLWIADQMLRN